MYRIHKFTADGYQSAGVEYVQSVKRVRTRLTTLKRRGLRVWIFYVQSPTMAKRLHDFDIGLE